MLSSDRHPQTLQRLKNLLQRKQQMKETRKNYIVYLATAAEMIQNHLRKSYSSVQNMMQNIAMINMTSDKCDQIRLYGKSMMKICQVYLKYTVKNISDLKKISQDQKVDQRVQAKYDQFLKAQKEFTHSQLLYNKQFQKYESYHREFQRKVNSLDQQFKNPLIFYNGQNPKLDLQTINTYYQKSRSSQQNLQTDFQELTLKDKNMSHIMKQLKDKFITLYQKNMINILDASKIIIQLDDQQILLEADKSQNYDDIGDDQMKKYQQIYLSKKKKNFSNQIASDFQTFFNTSLSLASRDSQYDFMEQRCRNVKEKLMKNVQSVDTQRKLLIKQLQNQINLLKELQNKSQACKKKVLSKNCQYQMANQKRLFKQCFGDKFSQIQQLTLTIYNYKITSFIKMGSYIDNNKEKIERIISEEQKSIRQFLKVYQKIIKEHQQIKQRVQLKGQQITSGQYQNYKANCQQTFKVFKKTFTQFNNQRKRRDGQFDQILKNLTNNLRRLGTKTQRQLITKESQKYNLFQQIQPISQVINLMKSSPVFDVLFKESFFFEFNPNFQSLLNKLNYDQIKTLINKKAQDYQNIRNKPRKSNNQLATCVPCGPKIKNQNQKLETFICKVIRPDKSSMKGQIWIQNKFVNFQKQNGFFTSSYSLYIPIGDVKNIIRIRPTEQSPLQTINIQTIQGLIRLKTGYLDQIEQLLKPLKQVQQNLEMQSIIKDSKNSGLKKSLLLNSSIDRKNVGISHYQTPSTAINISLPMKKVQSKLVQSVTYKDLMIQTLKALQDDRYLQNYKITHQQKDSYNIIRAKYISFSNYIKFNIKQSKRLNLFETDRIVGNYNWKITFDNFNLLKSYKHKQKLNIVYNMQKQAPDIQFIQTRASLDHQHYHQRMFYSQIQRMNKRLTMIIANIFQKDIEFSQIIEHQNQSHLSPIQQDSDLDDIFQIYKKQTSSKIFKPKASLDNFDLQMVQSKKLGGQEIRPRKKTNQMKTSYVPQPVNIVINSPKIKR